MAVTIVSTDSGPSFEEHCAICGALALNAFLCPIHQEEAKEFNHSLRGVSKYDRVSTSALSIDRRFQRPVNEATVKDITLNFNEYDLGLLTVSRRARENSVLDGQQRLTALLRMSYAWAPCEILEGLNFEQEIMIFVVRNERRKAVRQGVLFNDKAKAGIAEYAEAMSILTTYRYEVIDPGIRSGVAVNRLSCPKTVQTVHMMGKLAKTLYVIRTAWPDAAEPNRAEVLQGIAAFLEVNPHIKIEALADALARFPASEIPTAAANLAKGSRERRLWVHAYTKVVELYNYGRPDRTRVSFVPISNRAPRMWINR